MVGIFSMSTRTSTLDTHLLCFLICWLGMWHGHVADMVSVPCTGTWCALAGQFVSCSAWQAGGYLLVQSDFGKQIPTAAFPHWRHSSSSLPFWSLALRKLMGIKIFSFIFEFDGNWKRVKCIERKRWRSVRKTDHKIFGFT